MPRFVVLKHETSTDSPRPSHWDFMVESEGGDSLRTWALAEEPSPNVDIAAEQLPDHRRAYVDYEGPISENRGQVTQWDRGECTVEESKPTQLRVSVRGEKMGGTVVITSASASPCVFRWHSPNPES
jgi:hypothetical protein